MNEDRTVAVIFGFLSVLGMMLAVYCVLFGECLSLPVESHSYHACRLGDPIEYYRGCFLIGFTCVTLFNLCLRLYRQSLNHK